MKNIAVIGAGISGLAAAYLLSRRHRVQLFEQEPRLGGHTNTVLIATPDGGIPLDTGFLAHNDRTCPNLVRLFGQLGVATRDSDMSFAVSCRRSGLEYSSRGANGFFAQRRNLARPSHLSLLREILRFNREAPTRSTRRTGTARRWASFSSRAASVSASRANISCRWRRRSGRPRSTRSVRFRRPR
jgi:predicted NAD/FAD-binding protein